MIVQRHYTLQPYNMMLLDRHPPLRFLLFVCFVFLGIPFGSVIVIWCLRQSHRKSLGLLVPRLLDDINVPYLVKNTPEMNRRVVTMSQRRHGGSHLGADDTHNFTNTQNGQTKQPKATESRSGNLFRRLERPGRVALPHLTTRGRSRRSHSPLFSPII